MGGHDERCQSCGAPLGAGGVHRNHAASGQAHSGDPAVNIGNDEIIALDDARTVDAAPARRSTTQHRRRRDRRWLLALAGLAAAWLVVVGLGRLAAPDQPAAAPSLSMSPTATSLPAAPEPDTAVDGDQADSSTDRRTPRAGDTPAATATAPPDLSPAEPSPTPQLAVPVQDIEGAQIGARSDSSVQVERMVRQIGRRGSNAVLAYRSGEGVVLFDLAAGTAEVVDPSTTATELSPQYVVIRTGGDPQTIDLEPSDVLLRGAGQTIAIDPTTLDVRVVSDDASIIVADSVDGVMYWVPGRDLQGQAAEVIGLVGGQAEWFRSPHGIQLVVHDGLGLIAVTKTTDGETLIATDSEFVKLSDHRVVDGNAAGRLVRRCDDGPCRFVVFPNNGGGWAVPDQFLDHGDRYSLSPDARLLLRHTEHGFAEIYARADQSVSWVTGASLFHPAWGPDSTFVAWIDLLGAPELRVMFIDERDWLRIDLDDLGLPRPLGTELVVFERSTGAEQ